MDLYSEKFPYVYFRGRVTTFRRSERTRESYFGGPGKVAVTGARHGPIQLHHIATISTSDLGIRDSKFGWEIPFYYGMCFECCEVTYSLPSFSIDVASAPTIKITSIDPSKSRADWPYAGYPQLLPYLPLEVHETAEMSLESFSENVMQGINALSDDELVLVVPPNPTMGVSLWGPRGDAGDHQVVFIYDSKNGTICAFNAGT